MRAQALRIGAAALVVASIAATAGAGPSGHLPGIALGLPVLLHAERALALITVVIAAVSILVRAARGRLPIELSTGGMRYEAEAAEDAATAVADLQEQLDDLSGTIIAIAERLDALSRRP